QIAAGTVNNVGLMHFTHVAARSAGNIDIVDPMPWGVGSGFTKVSIMRIPHYKSVTLNADLTVSAFDRTTAIGGVLIFRSQGDVVLNGAAKIDVMGKGYNGALAGTGSQTGHGFKGGSLLALPDGLPA